VLRVAPGVAWVSCHTQAGCQRCAEGRGCGGDVLGRLLGDRLREVRVCAGDHDLRRGDEVLIGVTESALLKSSVVMYLAPLLTMLSGALLALVTLPGSEPGAILGSAAGLLAGLACARVYGRSRRAEGFSPRVVSRLSATDASRTLIGRQATTTPI